MSTAWLWLAEEKRKLFVRERRKREKEKSKDGGECCFCFIIIREEWRLLCLLRGQSPARGLSIPRNTKPNSFNRTTTSHSPTSPPSPPPLPSPRRRRPRPTPSPNSPPSPTANRKTLLCPSPSFQTPRRVSSRRPNYQFRQRAKGEARDWNP